MMDIWRPLLEVLDATLALYKELLVLSEEKRRVLIEAQHIALEEITRREAPLVLEGSRLEERRAKVTAALAINYQLANQKPTLSELAAVAEPEVSEYLSAYSEDLGGTTKELVRLNLLNADLIKQGMTFVNYNMNLLTRSRVEPTYAPVGQKAPQRSAAIILDRKV